MKYAPLAILTILAGCPSDDEGNPEKLYFAADGAETELKLQEEEPNPW